MILEVIGYPHEVKDVISDIERDIINIEDASAHDILSYNHAEYEILRNHKMVEELKEHHLAKL